MSCRGRDREREGGRDALREVTPVAVLCLEGREPGIFILDRSNAEVEKLFVFEG